MFEIPISAETIGDLLYDSPIRPAAFERLEHLIKPLDAALGAGERAFLFEAWAGGQNNIRKPAGVAEENVLDDKEIELGQGFLDKVLIRVHKADFLAEQVHRLEFSLVNRLDHFLVIQAFGGGKPDIPTRLEPGAHFRVIHELVTWKIIGHRAVIACSLHVIVAAQRIGAGAGAHVIPGHQQQV